MSRSLGYLVLLSTATASAAPAPEAPTPAPASSLPIQPPMAPSTAPGTRPASPRPTSYTLPAQPARVDGPRSPLVPLFVGTALGAFGFFAGGKLGIEAVGNDAPPAAIAIIALGALAGGSTAVTVAVMSTAGDEAHESSIAATWLGSVLGSAAGAVIAIGTTQDLTSGIILTGGTATLGAYLGHQMSQRRRAPLQLAPLVTTHTTGLALGGTF